MKIIKPLKILSNKKIGTIFTALCNKNKKKCAVFNQLIGNEQDEPSPTDSQWQVFLETDFEDIEQTLLESGVSENNIDEVLKNLLNSKTA